MSMNQAERDRVSNRAQALYNAGDACWSRSIWFDVKAESRLLWQDLAHACYALRDLELAKLDTQRVRALLAEREGR